MNSLPIPKKQATPKYRPSLSSFLISYTLKLATTEYAASSSPQALELISIFSVLQTKIENASIKPAYIEEGAGKEKLIDKLGGLTRKELKEFSTKEEYWKHCYEKYTHNLTNCSILEIKAAKEHMYINDLMSKEEIEEHEKSGE